MAKPTGAQLAKLFEKLGARDPQEWAGSQDKEGINQLARFLFLRQAWRSIVPRNNTWISEQLSTPDDPWLAPSVKTVLQRVRNAGVSDDDLTEIVRDMQVQVLVAFCYLLDDPGVLETEVAALDWGLFEVDGEGQPGERICGLHESVLETEPSF